VWSLLDIASVLSILWLLARRRRELPEAAAAAAGAGLTRRQEQTRHLIVALAIAGALQTTRLLFWHSSWTIDDGNLVAVGLAGGAVAFGILWVIAGAGRGLKSPRRWLFFAALGTLALSAVLLRDLNIDLDLGEGIPRTARVANKQSSMTVRGGTNYYLRLEDWTGEGRARELDLSRYRYGQFDLQQMVEFDEHPGALGIRWIGGLRPARPAPPPSVPTPR
jgi:hypothetical protein